MKALHHYFVIAAAVLLCAAASCSRPSSVETYRLNDGSGIYEFTLDFQDSTSVYDLSFYTRVDDADTKGFPMQVSWYSPSGQLLGERLWFDCSSPVSPYRRGCDPPEHGTWRIMVKADAPGMRGLGLICSARKK